MAHQYHVVVGVARSSFVGGSEIVSKAFRIEAADPITAGEIGIDRMVTGYVWTYRSVDAKVLDLETGDEVAHLSADDVKAFGVKRNQTIHQWQLEPSAPSRAQRS